MLPELPKFFLHLDFNNKFMVSLIKGFIFRFQEWNLVPLTGRCPSSSYRFPLLHTESFSCPVLLPQKIGVRLWRPAGFQPKLLFIHTAMGEAEERIDAWNGLGKAFCTKTKPKMELSIGESTQSDHTDRDPSAGRTMLLWLSLD